MTKAVRAQLATYRRLGSTPTDAAKDALSKLVKDLPKCRCGAPAVLGLTRHEPVWCREHIDDAGDPGQRWQLCAWWGSVVEARALLEKLDGER